MPVTYPEGSSASRLPNAGVGSDLERRAKRGSVDEAACA